MKVINLRKESYTHYIGRGSVFGNPFRIGRDGNRENVIHQYQVHLYLNPQIKRAIYKLPAEAILGCYCKPKACHGDVIIKIWKELHGEPKRKTHKHLF